MLLCLVDLRVLTAAEVIGILDDAAAAHLAPGRSPEETASGGAAAALIAAIAAGNNSVRRRSGDPSPEGGSTQGPVRDDGDGEGPPQKTND
jgi:hypothetical protein